MFVILLDVAEIRSASLADKYLSLKDYPLNTLPPLENNFVFVSRFFIATGYTVRQEVAER